MTDLDRTSIIPRHTGDNILPCSAVFSCLLRHSLRQPQKLVVRDARENISKTHVELIRDILKVRAAIQAEIGYQNLERLNNGEEVYISILAPAGYSYVVAFLAVLAIGAAVVPLSPVITVKEALYYVEKSGSIAVVASLATLELASAMTSLQSQIDPNFKCIHVEPSLVRSAPAVEDIIISSDKYLDDNKPGVVIFTSGTTGPPKGAVMRRAYTFDSPIAIVDLFGITSDDVMLHLLPMHHATGVGISFFPFLVAGACIEFKPGSFDEAWTWERWRQGALDPSKRITFFSGVPTIYMRMRRYFQQHLANRPNVDEYVRGAQQFRTALCGTSALPRPINDFWTGLMKKRIVQRYGATEFGAIFKVRLEDENVPDGSVGEKVPGADVKVREGNEGELLVKSAHMFSKYLGSPEATAAAHDEEGYYKTGDIVRREGNYWFILGRASIDIIKSGGYKISALDVEREILSLPWVSEVIVVGVEDEEFGQRVGAIITVRSEVPEAARDVTISRLRTELRGMIVGYKMPTLLRVVEGDLPKSSNGKVFKKVLGPKYFHKDYRTDPHVQVWEKNQVVRSKL